VFFVVGVFSDFAIHFACCREWKILRKIKTSKRQQRKWKLNL